eukprot:TRINITY_DN16924_c0_g1_i1.p1 TRINITY_DN16924_c0_g1~~TRINITY_DN16924_c0_g1_i1.p1  ORF type:complete len:192 (+),score=45.54 TRINITY_DN16924_c0_g1_i1:53-628(+)
MVRLRTNHWSRRLQLLPTLLGLSMLNCMRVSSNQGTSYGDAFVPSTRNLQRFRISVRAEGEGKAEDEQLAEARAVAAAARAKLEALKASAGSNVKSSVSPAEAKSADQSDPSVSSKTSEALRAGAKAEEEDGRQVILKIELNLFQVVGALIFIATLAFFAASFAKSSLQGSVGGVTNEVLPVYSLKSSGPK